MYRSFKLKSALAGNVNANPDDTLNAKKMFKSLGYYDTPNYGLNEFPDQPLFDGISKFQKDHGLQVDGVMKPSGETQTMVNHVVTRKLLADRARRSAGPGVDTKGLYGMFDRFTSDRFHGADGAYSTTCCATGTSDCEAD